MASSISPPVRFAYRLGRLCWPPDNSEGSRLYGGRWNHADHPVIYAAATPALAVLEVMVNHGYLAADHRFVEITIPSHVRVATLDPLPADWDAFPAQAGSKTAGTEWLRGLSSAVLCVPSRVSRREFNYLINPLHADFWSIRFRFVDDRVDERLLNRTSS